MLAHEGYMKGSWYVLFTSDNHDYLEAGNTW